MSLFKLRDMAALALLLVLLLCVSCTSSFASIVSIPPSKIDNHAVRDYGRFQTSQLHHIEMVQDYEIRHAGSSKLLSHFHSESVDAAPSTPSIRGGLVQPYPDSVSVSFNALGKRYNFESMSLVTSHVEPFTKTTYFENGEYKSVANYLTTYSHIESGSHHAVVTLFSDGRFQALVHDHSSHDIVQVDHIEAHANLMHENHHQRMTQSASRNTRIVAFKHSDLHGHEHSKCGAAYTQQSVPSLSTIAKMDATSLKVQSARIDEVSSLPNSRHLLAVDRWTNCYSGDSVGVRESIGWAVDYGQHQKWGNSLATSQQQVNDLFARMNTVYKTQIGIELVQTDSLVMTTAGGPVWNRVPPPGAKCDVTINQDLDDFAKWRQANKMNSASLWHLSTNCYPPPGVVGLAWVGTLCNGYYGEGVSSDTGATSWLITAHEIGHNHGAQHTFQLGQGKTGGIMDYGDGRLPPGSGDFQFNTQYSKTEMCAEINKKVATRGPQPYCFVSSPTTQAPATQYQWNTAAWSACSVYCGAGTQTREVFCSVQNQPTNRVADSMCTNLAKPAVSQACTGSLGASCVGQWVTGPWGSCSKACGSGTQTRGVQCQQRQASSGAWAVVADSVCYGLNLAYPVSSQVCNTQVCVNAVVVYGAFGTCSVSCGGGVQTRTATCINTVNNQPVDMSLCPAPVVTQPCNTKQCGGLSFEWRSGEWQACPVQCGGSTQTRVVQCYDKDLNTLVADTNCGSQTKPATTQPCGLAACLKKYVWAVYPYGSCSRSCGGGVATRSVICLDLQLYYQRIYTPQPDSACAASPKPATSQTCNLSPCAMEVNYRVSEWSTCSKSCGGGVQTRNVTCAPANGDTELPMESCGDAANRPASSRSCNTDACSGAAKGTWSIGQWSACTRTCGQGGQRQRDVKCVSNDGKTLAASDCDRSTDVSTVEKCDATVCTVHWHIGEWSACSASCGIGSQIRTVQCRYADDATGAQPLADSVCLNVAPKPNTVAPCNAKPCSRWVASEFGECSAKCGDGFRTRNITCVNLDGEVQPDTYCSDAPAPAVKEVCNLMPCPHWHREMWSECDRQCGGGNKTRALKCRMPHDGMYRGKIVEEESLCPALGSSGDSGDGEAESGVVSGKPTASAHCNIDACPAFYWRAKSKSVCSATCGGGQQTIDYECYSTAAGSVVPSAQCFIPMPPTTVSCNTVACAKYEWFEMKPFGNCSVYCGAGVQKRVVACRDNTPNKYMAMPYTVVDDSFCAALPKPSESHPCSFPTSRCHGNIPNQINGKCITDSSSSAFGTCECRTGFASLNCSLALSIFDVKTDAASYAHGVPTHDSLFVSWNFTGSFESMPFVSLIIVAADESTRTIFPIGQYIVEQMRNTGSYVWIVGSRIRDFEPGVYRLRVMQSAGVYADSESFRIADPCAYMSCGIYGKCRHGVCECLPGMTGPTCAVGPCERANCGEHSICNNDDYIMAGSNATSIATCQCKDGFSGPTCRTKPGCTNSCKNGGDMVQIDSDAASGCGVCSCSGMWSGSQCETCSLSCQNGGVADRGCTTCQCPVGFFGSRCECEYYVLTMRLKVDPTGWFADPIAQARFKRTLASDIAVAAAAVIAQPINVYVDEMTIDVNAPKSGVIAKVRLSLDCPSIAAASFGANIDDGMNDVDGAQAKKLRLIAAGAFISSSASEFFQNRQRVEMSRALQQQRAQAKGFRTESAEPQAVRRMSLNEVYTILASAFANADSLLYHGVASEYIDSKTRITATNPSNPSQQLAPIAAPTDPFTGENQTPIDRIGSNNGPAGPNYPGSSVETSGSGSSSLPIIIGAAAGGAVVLAIAAFAIYRVVRSRRVDSVKKHVKRASLEMKKHVKRASVELKATAPEAGVMLMASTASTPSVSGDSTPLASPTLSPSPCPSPTPISYTNMDIDVDVQV